MITQDVQIIFNALMSAISAGANLYYILKHANGKKNIRIMSFVIMMYFTIIQILFFIGTIPAENVMNYIRPWVPVLYFIPVFDVIVDFKKKKSTTKG